MHDVMDRDGLARLFGVQANLFFELFQRDRHVSALRHNAIKDLAFVVYGPPEIMTLPVDLEEHLAQMATPIT
jgi:hypothetical protein